MEKLKYNRIKEELASRGIKQTWLAEQLGKTFRQVNAYVTNNVQPPIPILFEIAEILNVPPRQLLCEGDLNQLRKRVSETPKE